MARQISTALPNLAAATMVRIERRLPAPGEILVRVGDKVEPEDLVGRCSVQGAPLLLHVSSALQIEPRQLRRYLRRAQGQRIAFRDIVARRGRRQALAPFTSTIADIDTTTGFVTLLPDPAPASVSAMLRGQVVAVEPEISATLETAAAVVEGAVGFGGEQWGLMRLLVSNPGEMIRPEAIDKRSAFSIIVAGAGMSIEALRAAQQAQVKAIIVGGLDAEALREWWGERFDQNWSRLLHGARPHPLTSGNDDWPALFATEGFGARPISRPIFELLQRLDRQEAHLDPTLRLNPPGRKPQLIIPIPRIPEGGVAWPEQPALRPGVRVRLRDEAHVGAVGTVESVQAIGRLESGIRTSVATILLDANTRVTLPTAHVEVFETL